VQTTLKGTKRYRCEERVRAADRFTGFTLCILASLALAGCAGGSSPFEGASDNQLLFVKAAQTWDINRDNTVSCDEWRSYTGELFDSADSNRDAFVDEQEYATIIKSDRLFQSAGMAFFDGNGDNKLTRAEFTERPNPAFEVLDKNKDCQIGSNEMVQVRAPAPTSGGGDSGVPNTTAGQGPVGRR